MILDSFILTFKDNSEPCITMNGSKIIPAQWLHDMTKGRAEYVGKSDDGIEIAMHIGDFLALKDKRDFQGRCSTLVRLRTTHKTILGSLCYPIGHIDNRLTP